MREAGVEDAELAICLTNDDKVNLLSAVMAKREGAQRTLCLVNEPGLKDVRQELGIDIMIDPRGVTVSTILQHIRRGADYGPANAGRRTGGGSRRRGAGDLAAGGQVLA